MCNPQQQKQEERNQREAERTAAEMRAIADRIAANVDRQTNRDLARMAEEARRWRLDQEQRQEREYMHRLALMYAYQRNDNDEEYDEVDRVADEVRRERAARFAARRRNEAIEELQQLQSAPELNNANESGETKLEADAKKTEEPAKGEEACSSTPGNFDKKDDSSDEEDDGKPQDGVTSTGEQLQSLKI